MKTIIEILLLLGFILLTYCARSQEFTQTIRGVVVDKESQMPLIGAEPGLFPIFNYRVEF